MCQAAHSRRSSDCQRAKLLELAVAIRRIEMVESRHPATLGPFHATHLGGDNETGGTHSYRDQLCFAGTRSIRLGREHAQSTNLTQQYANSLSDGPRSIWTCSPAVICTWGCAVPCGVVIGLDELDCEERWRDGGNRRCLSAVTSYLT